jgi:hypothetical protein
MLAVPNTDIRPVAVYTKLPTTVVGTYLRSSTFHTSVFSTTVAAEIDRPAIFAAIYVSAMMTDTSPSTFFAVAF